MFFTSRIFHSPAINLSTVGTFSDIAIAMAYPGPLSLAISNSSAFDQALAFSLIF